MMTRQLTTLALAATLAMAASAQEAAPPEDCISLMRLDHSDVVDDRTILFFLTNKEVRLNRLPSACPGLDTEERFLYRVTMNKLCQTDVITVLYAAGDGFLEGPTCQIGAFQPLSQEAAQKLREPKSAEAQ